MESWRSAVAIGWSSWICRKIPLFPVRPPRMEISVCRQALALDYLINLPVIKGHCQTAVTCALKNCKGLIPNRRSGGFTPWGFIGPSLI